MNKKVKKEIIEWTIMIVVIGGLYLTGLHTEVLGFLQRGLLATGVITPSIENTEKIDASYKLDLIDLNGNTLSLEEMKGQVVFMNFWATWCPPCIAEMPDIHKLYEDVGGNVSFVMISVDEDQNKARDFIAKKGFKFPVYFLNSAVPSIYSTRSIPTTYVISSAGQVAAQHSGMAKYNTDAFKDFLNSL